MNRASRYAWIYGLQNLTHESLTSVFQEFRMEAGALPCRLYTDFDNKLIAGNAAQWLKENNCHVRAAPEVHKEFRASRSSSESEVKTTDKCTKST